MPVYVYESLDGMKRYEFLQKMNAVPYRVHPETGESIKRVIASGITIKTQGLRKAAKVNKRSPAATACGCVGHKH